MALVIYHDHHLFFRLGAGNAGPSDWKIIDVFGFDRDFPHDLFFHQTQY
jgi:hypothetical protein